MTNLNHPNLVRFCGVCLDPPLLVMEYYHHGSVYNLLEKAKRQWIHSLTDTGAEAKDDKWSKKVTKDHNCIVTDCHNVQAAEGSILDCMHVYMHFTRQHSSTSTAQPCCPA